MIKFWIKRNKDKEILFSSLMFKHLYFLRYINYFVWRGYKKEYTIEVEDFLNTVYQLDFYLNLILKCGIELDYYEDDDIKFSGIEKTCFEFCLNLITFFVTKIYDIYNYWSSIDIKEVNMYCLYQEKDEVINNNFKIVEMLSYILEHSVEKKKCLIYTNITKDIVINCMKSELFYQYSYLYNMTLIRAKWFSDYFVSLREESLCFCMYNTFIFVFFIQKKKFLFYKNIRQNGMYWQYFRDPSQDFKNKEEE